MKGILGSGLFFGLISLCLYINKIENYLIPAYIWAGLVVLGAIVYIFMKMSGRI